MNNDRDESSRGLWVRGGSLHSHPRSPESVIELDKEAVKDIKRFGGSFLGSSRFYRPEEHAPALVQQLSKCGIHCRAVWDCDGVGGDSDVATPPFLGRRGRGREGRGSTPATRCELASGFSPAP